MTKKEIQAKISKIKKQKAEELKKKLQEKELQYYESEHFLTDFAKEQALEKLNKAITSLEVIYGTLDRKLIQRFGYSVIFDKLLTVASGTKFLPKDEKEVILKETGLTEISIEELLDAVGSPAYYSKEEHQVIPEVAFDRERVEAVLTKIEIEMGIQLLPELENISHSKILKMYKRAKNIAEALYANTEAMMAEEDINYEE